MLQVRFPLLLQNLQLFVLLSQQTLHVLQVNASHPRRLLLRLLQVALQVLRRRPTGSDVANT